MPRRALPAGAGRAHGRVLHPGRVERGSPALLVILSQLQIEALPVHPHRDVPNPGPRAESVECTVVGGHGAPGESDSCPEELTVLVEHWSAPRFDCSPWGRKMQREAPWANTGGRQTADGSSARSSSGRRSNES